MRRCLVIALMLACACGALAQRHRGPTDTAMLGLVSAGLTDAPYALFDGSTGYLTSSAHTLLSGNGYTFSVWLYSEYSDSYSAIYSMNYFLRGGFYMKYLARSGPVLYTRNSNTCRVFDFDTSSISNEWHHILVKISGNGIGDITNAVFQVDGVEASVDSTFIGSTPDAYQYFLLGIEKYQSSHLHFFRGRMSDAMLFDAYLTTSDSLALYNRGRSPMEDYSHTNMVSRWPFTENFNDTESGKNFAVSGGVTIEE